MPGIYLAWTFHGPRRARPCRQRTVQPPGGAGSAVPTGGPRRQARHPSEARGRLPHPCQHSKAPAPHGRRDRSPPHGQDRPPARTATVTVPPADPTGYAGHYCRTARSPAGRRHPRTGARDGAPRRRTCGRPAHAPPDRQASRSPGPPSRPSAHPPFPPAPPQGKATGPPGGHTGMHARLTGSRQAGTRNRRGPSGALLAKPVTAGPRGADRRT